jgi:hypothetical protein
MFAQEMTGCARFLMFAQEMTLSCKTTFARESGEASATTAATGEPHEFDLCSEALESISAL